MTVIDKCQTNKQTNKQIGTETEKHSDFQTKEKVQTYMLAHRQTHGQKNKNWGLMFCYYWVNEYLNKQKNKKTKKK